jgi:hypothetical protein
MTHESTKVPLSRRAKGCLGRLVILLLVVGPIWWLESLHERPFYKTDVVVAQPADGAGGSTPSIQVAVSEEALGELADASGKSEWIAALVTGKTVFQVPGEAKLAILDRNALEWSVSHPRHAGVALKVRVLDGEHAGQTGYVLAAWLKFPDQSSSKRAGGPAPEGKQAGDSTGADWQASCDEDAPFPSDPTGKLIWSFPWRKTKAEAQKDADFHNALRGHHAGVERGVDWGSLKTVPEPEGKAAERAKQGWIWTALCTEDHRKPPSANLAALCGRVAPDGRQEPKLRKMPTTITS